MMMEQDRMTLTVLDDGTAKLEVDGISGANHAKAEQIVDAFTKEMGGEFKIEQRPEKHRLGKHQHRIKHGH